MSETNRYHNSGILSRSRNKSDHPNAAPYGGQCQVDCPHCKKEFELWIKAWVNDTKDGKSKYFRFKFSPKQKLQTGPAHGPDSTPKPATEPDPLGPDAQDEGFRY